MINWIKKLLYWEYNANGKQWSYISPYKVRVFVGDKMIGGITRICTKRQLIEGYMLSPNQVWVDCNGKPIKYRCKLPRNARIEISQ